MSQPRPVEIRALSGEAHGYRGAKWFDLPVGKGYLWVEFFFMLSGFVLTYVYGARWRELWRGRNYLRFLETRLARLYPLHLTMLFVILFMMIVLRALAAHYGYVSIYDEKWHPINTWPSFVANLFLVQAWNMFPYLSWNGASWFVSVEFLLCLLIPLYFAIASRHLASAAILILGGASGLALLAVTSQHGLDLTFHNGIWRGMADFAMGVGLAVLYGRVKARSGAPLPTAVHSLAQLAVLAIFLYAIYDTGWAHRPEDIYTALAMVPLIFALSFDRGFLAALLQTKPVLRLGEWSYAIYIGQTALLQLLRHAQLHLYPAPADLVFGHSWASWEPIWHWLEPALLVGAAVLWGYILFALVERPSAAFLRGLMDRQRRGAAPA
jgi:peptidoglycan/LPS O-acetylase OafA/YrhL